MSEVSSPDTQQRANEHFSNHASREQIRSARVRLVPLGQAQRLWSDQQQLQEQAQQLREQAQWLQEQAQQLHTSGYQAEAKNVKETLAPLLSLSTKLVDSLKPLAPVPSPLAAATDAVKPLTPVSSPVGVVKPLASATNRTSRLITLAIACLGTFLVFLDSTIVTVALPTIQTNLHAQLSDLQWVVASYTLPLAVLTLTAGTFGDCFGRKRLLLTGLVLFLLGSTLCGFAPTISWFFLGRVLQGIGAAALAPGSLSLLVAAFPNPRERAQMIGIWSGISGIGTAVGPLAGGLLIQFTSWPAIFFINLPFGLLALALGWPLLTESRNPNARKLDLPGQALMVGVLTCLVVALIESTSQGWTSPLILSLLIGSGTCLVAFLLVEARVHEPMLPLGLFGNRVFSVANATSLISGFAFTGTVFFIGQFFQEVQGFTAIESGLRTLPITAGIFLVGPLAGRLASTRLGPRLPIVLGALLLGSGLLLLTRLAPSDDYATLWWNLGMLGTGYGLMISPITIAVLSATPPNRAGLGSSVVSTSRQIGVSLGIAVLGAFVAQQFASNIVSQLTQRGVPASISTSIASKIASAGAQADPTPLSGGLPLPPQVLHNAIGRAFVDSLDQSFFISGITILAIALLVGFFLYQKRRSAPTGLKPVDWQATPSASPMQQAVAVGGHGSTSHIRRSTATPLDYAGSAKR